MGQGCTAKAARCFAIIHLPDIKGGGVGGAERMRAAEREGRRGPAEKQEERCLDP